MNVNRETSEADLLVRGIAAARAGDNEEARRLLRRVTELEPLNAEAWLWRADLAETTADKKAFLEEVLNLEPENTEAKLALEKVTELEGDLAARAAEEPLFCEVHPDRETMLRCNRCGRAMCTECSVRHPVGLRCRECVRQTRSPIYQVSTGTTAKALVAATIASIAVSLLFLLLALFIGRFGIFGLLIAFFIGGALGRVMGEAVQRLVPRKRGRSLQVASGVGVFLGFLVAGAAFTLVIGVLPNLLIVAIYLGTAIPAVVASLR
jgi:hypothetical protein